MNKTAYRKQIAVCYKYENESEGHRQARSCQRMHSNLEDRHSLKFCSYHIKVALSTLKDKKSLFWCTIEKYEYLSGINSNRVLRT